MQERCHNEKHKDYPSYGGRGIHVCDRWRNSYDSFLEDMGERPAGTSLDRFPNGNGNYEPGNCRWATPREQRQNQRDYLPVEFNGVAKSIPEWANDIGISDGALSMRLKRWGDINRAMTEPKKHSKGRKRRADGNAGITVRYGRYVTLLSIDGRKVYVGTFASREEAVAARVARFNSHLQTLGEKPPHHKETP